MATGKIEITAHNHNFAVDPDSLKQSDVDLTHIDLNDNTLEGLRHRSLPLFSVQYHPEAAPGPHDSHYLFKDFVKSDGGVEGVDATPQRHREGINHRLGAHCHRAIGGVRLLGRAGLQGAQVRRLRGGVWSTRTHATIMTDPEMADRTYIEPLTRVYLEEIIRIEANMLASSGRPGIFAVLPTAGGQTAPTSPSS